MAIQRLAKIVSSIQLNSETKLLNLALATPDLLHFTGGQYVIVNTNIPLPGGKIAKRAYSILSSDADQEKFHIAVKKVGSGPGSNFMHETQVNSELPFSGPWGQFIVDSFTSIKSTFIIATDTGITAALGLIQSSLFRTQVRNAKIFWLVESTNYFIPKQFVESRVYHPGNSFQIDAIPSVNSPDRLRKAQEIFSSIVDHEHPETVFLSGDGALLYPFREELISKGIKDKQIKIECFFNNPFKKVGAK